MTTNDGMRVTYANRVMTVQRGTVGNRNPRKFRSESAFWYALKQHLNGRQTLFGKPCDLVKRVMSKDGHMVGGDDYPYYLRDRKWAYCIVDSRYETRLLHDEFNTNGVVTLTIEHWEQRK